MPSHPTMTEQPGPHHPHKGHVPGDLDPHGHRDKRTPQTGEQLGAHQPTKAAGPATWIRMGIATGKGQPC